MQSHQEWEDTMYPSGTGWREDIGIVDDVTPFRHYLGNDSRDKWQGACYEINCATVYGGCGCSISGGSKEEVINKWNRRVK
jgi:hypothetical protein